MLPAPPLAMQNPKKKSTHSPLHGRSHKEITPANVMQTAPKSTSTPWFLGAALSGLDVDLDILGTAEDSEAATASEPEELELSEPI